MQLTVKQFSSIIPENKKPQDVVDALNPLLKKYNINTVNRVAGFLAQCGHESAGFNILKENLNYSAKGLRGVFSKYFPDDAIAAKYERKPEMIASRVYANRMGNANEASKDGYKFRGRGAIQLTGHDNYKAFADSIDMTIDEVIPYLETLEGALESACWFWKKTRINDLCDNDDIVTMTKRINGGTNGLADRKAHYEKAKKVL